MTPTETSWLLSGWLAGGLFVAGVIIGAAIYALIARRLHLRCPAKAQYSEQQLSAYRTAVSKHLSETSTIVQQLGTNYQNLVTKISQDIHELSAFSPEDKPQIPPVFPSSSASSTQSEYLHTAMPKTYVDYAERHKD